LFGNQKNSIIKGGSLIIDKKGISRLKISIKNYPKGQKSAIMSFNQKNLKRTIN